MSILRKLLPAVLMGIVTLLAVDPAHASPGRPALLAALDGHWVMTGDVMGKPVQYDMEAHAVLQGTFTDMHMNDVQRPSHYEADVFIGTGKNGQLIVHWLDSFGADYSIPHGTGAINGNTMVFHFPYSSGEFRDTLSYAPADHVWTLLIEAAKTDGSWSHFAQYTIRRKPGS